MTRAPRPARPRLGTKLLLGLVVALVLAATVLALPAGTPGVPSTPGGGQPVAQTVTPDPAPVPTPTIGGGLRLVDQTDWVARGETFVLRVAVPPELPDDAEIVLDLHRSVTSRSQFTATLEGNQLGRRLTEVAVPLSEVPELPDGSRRIQLTPELTGAPGERLLPDLPSFGVHPLVVSVRPPDPADDGPEPFTTYLVRSPEPVVQPLVVAVVQPFGAEPAHQTDGTVALEPDTVADLASLATTLDAADIPLSIAPRPETVEAFRLLAEAGDQQAADVLDTLRAALPGRQVVSLPYVDVEPDSLEAAGLGGDLVDQRRRGDAELEETLGVDGDHRTWLAGNGASPRSLRRLAELGVHQLVLPDAALEPVALRLTLTRPFAVPIGGSGASLAATAPDPALSARYRASDTALAAQHLLADLAVLHGDEPSSLTARGVVVAPPRGVHPDPVFLGRVLGGINSAPHLLATDLTTYFADVAPEEADGQVLQRRTTASTERLGITAADLAAVRARLDGFSSMVAAGPGAELVRELHDLTLVAQSRDLGAGERHAFLRAVDERIERDVRSIGVVDRAAYRLPDSEGTIPLTLVQDAPYPLDVRVTLESDKLDFGPPDDRSAGRASFDLTLAEENTPLVVPVSVRSPGTFPLLVSVTSPDGALAILETAVTVRSTAFSGVGIALSVSAGAFLLLWWGRHWRTARRARHLVPAP